MTLVIQEHSSPKYSPRTFANAKVADLTVAFAVEFCTAGEKCTHKAAGDRYVSIDILRSSPIEAARVLWKHCNRWEVQTLNIAGNGIYTLANHEWSQERINQYVYDVLAILTKYLPIFKIVSGGQTGVDIAGLVAAYKLGIPCVGTLPKGFIQRDFSGRDREYPKERIVNDIIYFSKELR